MGECKARHARKLAAQPSTWQLGNPNQQKQTQPVPKKVGGWKNKTKQKRNKPNQSQKGWEVGKGKTKQSDNSYQNQVAIKHLPIGRQKSKINHLPQTSKQVHTETCTGTCQCGATLHTLHLQVQAGKQHHKIVQAANFDFQCGHKRKRHKP